MKNIFEYNKNDKTHKVWYKFMNWIRKNWGKEWYKNFHGYEIIKRVEKYVKKNPEIKIVHCDDNVHAGSVLVIIPHYNMGNTVLFIPQCIDQMNMFFLYPSHQKELLKTLKKMKYKNI